MNTSLVSPPPKLGEWLIDDGLIDQSQLDQALRIQSSQGGKLGVILSTLGHLNPLALTRILSKQQSIPHINLETHPADDELMSYDELDYYLAYRCIPWRIVNGHMVIACSELTDRVKHWAQQFYHDKVTFVLVTRRDITNSIKRIFGDDIDLHTRTQLMKKAPHFSAFNTFYPKQRQSIVIFLISLIALFMLFPRTTLIAILAIVNIFYACTIGLKILLYTFHKKPKADAHKPVAESDLPIYTILVPLYKEALSVPHILASIRAIDYPKMKLDVKLVVEEDDNDTINAIKQAHPESYFEMIRVPYSLPRTKPKACNYALTFARGDYVTIYDAEDRPEPSQLKKAVAAFWHYGSQTVCLQARLNYYNWHEHILAKLFAIEYSALFDFMLPGLQRLGMPIPLGGTSNHIDLKRLREIGEWDPYNVTEDADLGMRLAMRGYKTRMLDSITLEEAPMNLSAWVKQRSRWIKGYMQTWLVYMRHPRELYSSLTQRGFWGFQFFIGGPCLAFLMAPFLWIFSLLWAFGLLSVAPLPDWLLISCISALALGVLCHLWFAIVAVRYWKWRKMGNAILFFPFYWLLHSIASFKALWQLIFRPHFWEKTTHGLTKLTSNDRLRSMHNLPA